jgi:quercetin dioxygenase-like cupin family protein
MNDSESEQRAAHPLAVRSGEGEARWWLGNLALFKATSAETGGRLTVMEITEPPGETTPPTVDHRRDVGIWVLEGELTYRIGESTGTAGPGDFLYVPRGTPQSWQTGEQGGRYLAIWVPGGIEEFVRQVSEPAERPVLPPPLEQPPDGERLQALAREYGVEPAG